MLALVVIGLIVAVPFVWSVMGRVSATYLFVGVTVGNLFVHQFSDDAALVVSAAVRGVDATLVARIALQFIPVLLVLVFARRTLAGNKLVVHGIPLLSTCIMLGILSLQLVPDSIAAMWYGTAAGQQVRQAEGLIVGVTAAMQLLLILSSRQPRPHKSRKDKH